MKRSAIVEAAVAFTALFCAIGASAAAADKAPTVSKEQREKGMAAAPGLVTAGGLDCQVADARLIGQGKDPKTKVATTLYELACTGNEGLIVEQIGTQSPQAFTCAQADEPGADGKQSNTLCILPANADSEGGSRPLHPQGGQCVRPRQNKGSGSIADQCRIRDRLPGRRRLHPGGFRPAASGQAGDDGTLHRLSPRG